ncbi:MAG: glycosyl transferase family 36, partial [Firmicutes bacterium]|nr:glycosyl transferase family 36 [Bacillota bacterium]
MILQAEELRQKAHELALTHDSSHSKLPVYKLKRRLAAAIHRLRAFRDELRTSPDGCSQPAEEWLLDNAEFIEEQVLVVREQLSGSFLRLLPRLRKSGEPRVLALCSDYLEHVDSHLDEEALVTYVNGYQEVAVLSLAEVWSFPLILRIALLLRLAEVMQLVRERREACLLVQRLLAQLEPTRPDPSRLKDALEEAGQDLPLSGPVVVQLIKQLREWADDSATVREWLLCKLENEPESLDKIVAYEYQLQASYQVITGNIINSLRTIARWDWRDTFERLSLVERTLRQECTGIYPLLDFSSRDLLRKNIERLSRRLCVPENLVAKQAAELAAEYYENTGPGKKELPRRAFIAYYLQEAEGVRELICALKTCSTPHLLQGFNLVRQTPGFYLYVLAGLFLFFTLAFTAWGIQDISLKPWQWLLVLFAAMLPAGEWAVTFFHWLIECLRPAEPLLRYDFSAGIPDEAATMVVIPVIWSSAAEARELVDRLELHYLANRDPNLHFALLGDFADAGQEHLPGDEEILAAARDGIEALNRSYSRPGGSTFHLFQRRRLWNPGEGVWMGWERKRGKLVEFTELLKGKKDTTFTHVTGDKEVLARIRYIITLDADTKLPLGTAQQLVGSIHLPYNRPRLNKSSTRVVEGYGVLQPRISISHDAARRSRFVSLWSADPGIDPYAFAVSDPYQDGLGQGIFTGKGIFDVDTFVQVLNERIPDNMVLSHDLLEGGFLRAGLLSDIELIDDHPATFYAYQKRQHRWVRGDWQLLPWLFPRVRNRRGELQPVDLSPLTRWQIVDNLRRSLLLPGLLALLFAALTVLPGPPGRWFALIFTTLFLPVFRHLAAIRWALRRPVNFLATAGQVLLTLITLPYQAAVLLDAVCRTIVRLFFTKRHLLEWVSAAEVERRSRGRKTPALQGMPAGFLLSFLFALAALSQDTPGLLATGLALSALWFITPFIVRWLDMPVKEREIPLTAAEKEEFTKLAREIWSFFRDFVIAEHNWLPPDNVQLDPPRGVARRTSPTNIGLYLACALAARDLGFIDTPGLIAALERTISVVERLEKWHGHLYNWYNIETLEPLPPRYISTVDSGNFVSCLLVVKTGLSEWLASSQAAVGAEDKARGKKLLARLEQLIAATDFRPLYDQKTKLFALGYNGDLQKRDRILYDLLASEARQASFLALALGQVPAAHWYALGRSMTRVGRRITLLSWAGTMFEYLMPSLFLRTYRHTVWESTYHAVVRRQIEYAHQRGVPFGISESGYYAFDHQLNYQYRAFGVPGLGFKRDLEQDLVISPYATILALPFARQEVLQALRAMEALGGRGKYGFYEAIDFTAERLPRGRKHMVVRSFMAHHQGMSLLALTNLLSPHKMYERFHRDKRVRSAELMLQERIPAQPRIIRHPALARVHLPYQEQAGTGPYREFSTADTPAPEVCVLANGALMTVVTTSGSGFCRYRGLAVSRWREDPVLDNWGSYIYLRDVNRNIVWSPTYQPCRVPPAKQRIQFSLNRAVFMREDGEIKTSLEICVSPEWDAEIRRLTLANTGSEPHIIEVTTFQEPVLAPPLADELHPAFSKLFLETSFEEKTGCLVARRRPRREAEQEIWAAHSLIAAGNTLGPVEYETDRACFIGRGYTLARPRGITARLRGKTGSVADPAFIMRRRIKIEPGEQVQLFAVTTVGGTKEDVINIVGHFTTDQAVERTFQMAWNHSQIELRHLHLTGDEAMV